MVSAQAPERRADPAVPDVPHLPEWVARFINLVNHPQDVNVGFPIMRMPNQRQVDDARAFIEDNAEPEDGTHYGYAWWHSGAVSYVVYTSHRWWNVQYDRRDDTIVHEEWFH